MIKFLSWQFHKPKEIFLSFDLKSEGKYLGLIEIGWEFIFNLIKYKLKRKRIGLTIIPYISEPTKKQQVNFYVIENKYQKRRIE